MSLQPIDEFFDLNDFAIPAVYKNAAGIVKNIMVIFDDAYSEIQIGAETFQNTKPLVWCKATDVLDATTKGTIQITTLKDGLITYNIMGVQSDILGVTKIILSADST